MSAEILRRCLLAACLSAACLTESALACLWDSDTLIQERSRFPSVLELITGKFLRHSPEFYQWRAANRKAKIESGKHSAADFDDLAVALDKLGQHKEAIAVMGQKQELYPDQYETYANLGTFHIHGGDWKEGAKWIAKAIEVNPDAHFGRERFQLLLVNYLLDRDEPASSETTATETEPAESPGEATQYYDVRGFAEYVLKQHPELDDAAQEKLLKDALRGVQGMMRFGNYDSPILLEALGDLLIREHSPQADARRLAARAYLRASDRTSSEDVGRLRKAARDALEMHEGVQLADVEHQLRREIAEADQWYQELAEREKKWIADPDADPEANFQKLYSKDPELTKPSMSPALNFRRMLMLWIPLSLVGVGIVALTCWRRLSHA